MSKDDSLEKAQKLLEEARSHMGAADAAAELEARRAVVEAKNIDAALKQEANKLAQEALTLLKQGVPDSRTSKRIIQLYTMSKVLQGGGSDAKWGQGMKHVADLVGMEVEPSKFEPMDTNI